MVTLSEDYYVSQHVICIVIHQAYNYSKLG